MTPRELKAYLHDISEACAHLVRFTEGKSIEQYMADPLLRSGVERQFEIVGEALSQAVKYFPEVADKITEADKIIAFRNRLIHGYATVSDEVVWGVLQGSLPRLRAEVAQLLEGP
jgi:uncharacterized protein with HEPN domain